MRYDYLYIIFLISFCVTALLIYTLLSHFYRLYKFMLVEFSGCRIFDSIWFLICISIRFAKVCGFASSMFMFRTWKSSWRRRKQQDRNCSWRKCSVMPKSRNWRKIMPLVKIQTKRCVCVRVHACVRVPPSKFCI